MKLPYCHILYYNSHSIVNMNGVYRITDMAYPGFLNLTEAKRIIDEYEQKRMQQLFDNQNTPNETNRLSEKI